MEQAQTIQQVVDSVVKTVAIIAVPAAAATFGLLEMIKKAGLNTRWIGMISWVLGFGIAILFCNLFKGTWFDSFNILTGVLVGFGTAGAYSGVKKAME